MARRSKSQPEWKTRIKKRMDLLRHYKHEGWGNVTVVSDDILMNSVTDPWYYPADQTVCATCGLVPMRDVYLKNNRTLLEAYHQMRRETPLAYKILRLGGTANGLGRFPGRRRLDLWETAQ